MKTTMTDWLQAALRGLLYSLTIGVYIAFAALILLVFGGFAYSFLLGVVFA